MGRSTPGFRFVAGNDPPGLAILATMARCQIKYPLTLASLPVPHVFEGEDFDYDNPKGRHALQYNG